MRVIQQGCIMSDKKSATIAVRTGITSDPHHHAVVPPLYLTTNFEFPQFGEVPEYDYARGGHPTRTLLQNALAALENGAGAVVTNCGLSAIHLMLCLLKPEDLLVAPHDCYGGTYRLFDAKAQQGAFQLRFVDQTNEAELDAILAKRPKLIWIETPSNPLLRVVDIAKICQKAAEIDAWVAVDNTFLSPILQQPLNLGADFVIHSTTKYINGHSDSVGGVIVTKTVTLFDTLTWWGNCIGATGNAFDNYMTLRGLRTLPIRMRQHEENCAAVLSYLQVEPLVQHIYHPSLPSHVGHEIACRQQAGFGGMLSFEMKGHLRDLKVFLSSLKLFSLAESLGGVESLVAHPASMTHRAMSDEAQLAAGLAPSLLRLSVGLEDVADLIADLKQAFDKVRENQ